MRQVFEARVWREGDWYVAQALEVEVASQGRSQEQALSNLREALELYFEPSPSPGEYYHPVCQEESTDTESQIHHVEIEIATT